MTRRASRSISTVSRDASTVAAYRGTSLMRNTPLVGPYRRPMPMVLEGSQGGGRFLMGEVPPYVGPPHKAP